MAERTTPSTHRTKEERKRRSNRTKPKRQERRVGKSIAGRRQPGSGAYDDAKGDVRRDAEGYIEEFPTLVECKRVTYDRKTGRGKSIGVKAEWLSKITKEAFDAHKHPALAIQFDKEVMDQLAKRGMGAETDWVMFPLSTVQAIFEALGQEGPEVD